MRQGAGEVTTDQIEADAPTRQTRRWLKPAIIAGGIIVFLVAAFFVADASLRAYAQGRIADEIKSELPNGFTANDLTVDIGGFSVISQYLGGSFDTVSLDADDVRMNGVPAQASIVAHGVPIDFSKPVASIKGSMVLDQDAANRLVKIPGATSKITFGDGTVGYSGSTKLFGLSLTYTAVVEPKADGTTIQLAPKSVKLTGGPAGLDLSGIVSQVLGDKPFPLCVAQFLPQGVTVTDVTIEKGSANATVMAENIVLDQKTFENLGSCS
jgi:hypothetical protein